MPLETATYISDLVSSNPVATDPVNQGDDHLRLLKSVQKTTWPGVNAAASRVIGGSFGFLAGAGSSSSPSYSFSTNSSLGLYDTGSGLGFAGNASFTGNATFAGSITAVNGTYSGTLTTSSLTSSSGTFTGQVTAASYGNITMPGANASFEVGAVATANTPFFDWHSSGLSTDYDVRFLASGGTSTPGKGTLSVTAATVAFSETISAATANVTTLNVSGTGTFGTVVGALPAGFIADFAGTAVPTGWAACDGTALSRTTFSQLFANIGTTWGAGDGSTTFNVPNLISRFRRHRDNSTLSGAVGNTQAPVNLTHTHGVSGTSAGASNTHTHDLSSGAVSTVDLSHTHGVNLTSGAMSANASHTHGTTQVNGGTGLSTNGGSFSYTGGATAIIPVNNGFSINSTNTDHTHSVIGNTAAMSANATHSHTITGNSGVNSADHTHSISLTSAATGDANEARPYSATVLTCIKLFN